MVATLVLNNAWPSSGGFAQYMEWAGGPAAPTPTSAERSVNGFTWDRLHFFAHVSRFFEMPEAVKLSHQHIRALLSRRNSLTGRLYASDPTIMSWELANEPRAMGKRAAYRAWIVETSQLVKKLAPNHLVTIGSEGAHADLAERWLGKGVATGWQAVETAAFEADHAPQSIDYATCHLWPEPWGWYDQDPKHGDGTATINTHLVERTTQYMQAHVQAAARIGKPLVISEVGLARDGERYGAVGAVDHRNRLYQTVLTTLQASVEGRDALAGVGFSGWAGEGRRKQHAANEPRGKDAAPAFRIESNVFDDTVYDNSVYDKDITTVRLISSYAVRWRTGDVQSR